MSLWDALIDINTGRGGRNSKPEQPAHCELHLIPFNISFEGFDVLRFVFFQFYF